MFLFSLHGKDCQLRLLGSIKHNVTVSAEYQCDMKLRQIVQMLSPSLPYGVKFPTPVASTDAKFPSPWVHQPLTNAAACPRLGEGGLLKF